MFNPAPSAASFFASRPVAHLVEMIFVALAQALPDDAPAMQRLRPRGDALADPQPAQRTVHLLRSASARRATVRSAAATGRARSTCAAARATCVVPAEVLEQRFPIVRHRCGPRWRTPAGPGAGAAASAWRRSRSTSPTASASSARTCRPAPAPILGLAGGRGPSRMERDPLLRGHRQGAGPPNCRADNLPIAPGDRAISWTAGGGGYGDPRERDLAAVAEDVRNGYVTPERALADYGVAVDEDGSARRLR